MWESWTTGEARAPLFQAEGPGQSLGWVPRRPVPFHHQLEQVPPEVGVHHAGVGFLRFPQPPGGYLVRNYRR